MNPGEEDINVFDVPIEEMSTEYLEYTTDQFTCMLLSNIMGPEMLNRLDEQGEARITAVQIADRFLKMMHERSVRVAERKTQVDWLNNLLQR